MSFILSLPAAASDSAATKSVTIRVLVRPATQTITDVAPKTLLVGKYTKGDKIKGTLTLRNAVRQFGKAKGARVGTSSVIFTALSSLRIRANVIAKFPGGTVHARGVGGVKANAKVPVVDGTGIYAGATGVVEGRGLVSGGARLHIYRLQVPS